MSTRPVSYAIADGIATICIDDGKRNALSPELLREIYAAFDRAEADNAIVVITGREDVFSAGFDLKVMKRGGPAALRMLKLGYSLTARVMDYPRPVIAACNGHSFAMGVFLMLSCDYVFGSRGDYKISANEVAIGLTMPRVAAATLKNRLTPSAFQRAVNLSQVFDVDAAREAGFFDEVVNPSELLAAATQQAEASASLDQHAHAVSKRRIRKTLIRRIRRDVWLDLLDALLLAVRGSRPRSS